MIFTVERLAALVLAVAFGLLLFYIPRRYSKRTVGLLLFTLGTTLMYQLLQQLMK